MADAIPSRRSLLPPSWRAGIQAVAGVAALFCLVVSAGLVLNQARRISADPLNAPGLAELRLGLVSAPDDESLKQQIRKADWQARQLYFAYDERTRTGTWLLLGGALGVLVCLAVLPLTQAPEPDLDRLREPSSEWKRRQSARRGLLAGGGLLMLLAVLLAGSVLW